MSTVTDAYDEGEKPFPTAWRFDEDGEAVTGTYAGIDSAMTSYGPAPIILLDVDNQRRALWLLQTALRSKFTEELARRGAADFDLGERISVKRLATKESANGRSYRPFRVIFHDRPDLDARSVLGLAPNAPTMPELASDGDDEPPF